jgi:F0F1-type ATP synthase membrane subunit c/vacuolar-type H+-ATPase subunit K
MTATSGSEHARRVQTLVHTALLAGIGIYAVLLVFLRHEIAATSSRPPGTALFLVLAGVGLAQYATASAVGRTFLRSPRARPVDRVRLYFLLRGAAAEAIALYGLVLGFLGGRALHVGALLAMGFVGLLASMPGRLPWEAALRHAETPEVPPPA